MEEVVGDSVPVVPKPAPAADEDDLGAEAGALAANLAFMTYLAECHARGDREGRNSFDEVWREMCDGSVSDD